MGIRLDHARELSQQGLDPKDSSTLAELTTELLNTLGICDPETQTKILALPKKTRSSRPPLSMRELQALAAQHQGNQKVDPQEEDEVPAFGRFRRRAFPGTRSRRELAPAQEVVPGIFLGGSSAAEDRQAQLALGITHVLNATNHRPRAPLGNIKMLMLHLRDADGEQDLTKHFPASIQFMDEARKEGAVLVHCVRGVSRSAALVIAYLIARGGLSFDDALALTKRARPVAGPRPGFCKQLRSFEAKGDALIQAHLKDGKLDLEQKNLGDEKVKADSLSESDCVLDSTRL